MFDDKFGSEWRRSEEKFWDDFRKSLSLEDGVILK